MNFKFLAIIFLFLLMSSVNSFANFNLKFSTRIPPQTKNTLISDLHFIESLSFENQSTHDLTINQQNVEKLFNFKKLNVENFKIWLQNRVQVLVEESFSLGPHNTKIINDFYTFPSPIINNYETPILPEPTLISIDSSENKTNKSDRNVNISMSNEGSNYYEYYRNNQYLVRVKVSGAGSYLISSPRVGIIKVGNDLYSKEKYIHTKYNSVVNRIYRTSILYHEARHSDGHGKNLGFNHAYCPPGHDLEGYAACDRNLNGPHSIDGTFIVLALNACKSCKVSEKENLRLKALDSFNRVIKSTPIFSKIDQKILDLNSSYLLKCADKNLKLNCSQIDIKNAREKLRLLYQKKDKLKVTPSIFEDDSPEGLRGKI